MRNPHAIAQPEISEALAKALDESADVSEWIAAHHPTEIKFTRNHWLAGPSYAMCMEHREAILLLLRHNSKSSAFALLRAVFETCMRGIWAEFCAIDKHFDQVAKTDELPKFDTVIKDLDKVADGGFGKAKASLWKPMSHFAHGGMRQLERWAGSHGIGAIHPDSEAIELLRHVDLLGVLACAGVARMTNDQAAAAGAVHNEMIRGMVARFLVVPPATQP